MAIRAVPQALADDGRFMVVQPIGEKDVLDVIELATGTTRRVEANAVLPLRGAEVLFVKAGARSPVLRREALDTGAVAWTYAMAEPSGRALSETVAVDPRGAWLAIATAPAGTWALTEPQSGAIRTYMALPDEVRGWSEGALLVGAGAAVRTYRPEVAALQMPYSRRETGLAPFGRFAAWMEGPEDAGEFVRVELATGERQTFRCPLPPPQVAIAGCRSTWRSTTRGRCWRPGGKVGGAGGTGKQRGRWRRRRRSRRRGAAASWRAARGRSRCGRGRTARRGRGRSGS